MSKMKVGILETEDSAFEDKNKDLETVHIPEIPNVQKEVKYDEREYDSALRSFKTFTDEQLKNYAARIKYENDSRIVTAYGEEMKRRGYTIGLITNKEGN
jgi:hypothetical protein